MKTFDFEPTTVPHTLKTRILKLWNPTASPLRRSIATQSLREGRTVREGGICNSSMKSMTYGLFQKSQKELDIYKIMG